MATAKKPASIAENLEQSILKSSGWLGDADLAAIQSARRLAVLLDDLFNMGDASNIAPLLARFTALLNDLHLTPRSRQEASPTQVKETSDGDKIQDAYLRLINPAPSKQAGEGKKPRTGTGGASGKPRRTPAPVAK